MNTNKQYDLLLSKHLGQLNLNILKEIKYNLAQIISHFKDLLNLTLS